MIRMAVVGDTDGGCWPHIGIVADMVVVVDDTIGWWATGSWLWMIL